MRGSRKVRVKVPLPDKEHLKEMAERMAERHHIPGYTPQDDIRFYIQCRLDDIDRQELEIAKARKRIRRLRRCIRIATEALKELDPRASPQPSRFSRDEEAALIPSEWLELALERGAEET